MLRRIDSAKNQRGRVWYQGERIDLTLWHDKDGALARFDIAQRAPYGERLLRWAQPKGFSWHRIDSGEDRAGHHKAAALLHDAAASPLRDWRTQLASEADDLPDALRQQLFQLLEAG